MSHTDLYISRLCRLRSATRLFLLRGGAFDAAGGAPGAEFIGEAGVFVVHDGIEFLHIFGGGGEGGADEGGIAGAFLDFAVVLAGGGADGVEVAAEVGDEVTREFVVEEALGEGLLGGSAGGVFPGGDFDLGEDAVGEGKECGFGGVFREAVVGGDEGGIVEGDGARGAGDVLEVGAEFLQEVFLADEAWFLTGFGGLKGGDVRPDPGEESRSLAGEGEVRCVFGAKGADAQEALVTKLFAIVHDRSR